MPGHEPPKKPRTGKTTRTVRLPPGKTPDNTRELLREIGINVPKTEKRPTTVNVKDMDLKLTEAQSIALSWAQHLNSVPHIKDVADALDTKLRQKGINTRKVIREFPQDRTSKTNIAITRYRLIRTAKEIWYAKEELKNNTDPEKVDELKEKIRAAERKLTIGLDASWRFFEGMAIKSRNPVLREFADELHALYDPTKKVREEFVELIGSTSKRAHKPQ